MENTQLAIHLTQDDNQQPLLHVEAGGYFPIPPHVISELHQARVYFPEKDFSEMSVRFILHAMLSNQANV